jgi:hypothetical protein
MPDLFKSALVAKPAIELLIVMDMEEQLSATFWTAHRLFHKSEKGDCGKQREYRDKKFPVEVRFK